jgi:hypothetical protein
VYTVWFILSHILGLSLHAIGLLNEKRDGGKRERKRERERERENERIRVILFEKGERSFIDLQLLLVSLP